MKRKNASDSGRSKSLETMLDNKKIRQLNIHLLVSITSTVRHLENDLFVPRMSAAFYYSIFVSIRYGRALVSSELGAWPGCSKRPYTGT